MWWKRFCRLVSCIALCLMILGCATKKTEKVRFLWPIPPEQPRLEFVHAFAGYQDFPRSGFAKFFDVLLGREDKLTSPQGVHAAGDTLYVADSAMGNILAIDFKHYSYKPLLEVALLKHPVGIDLDSDGNIYVADSALRKIVVLTPEGERIREFGGGKVLKKPEYLAVDERRGRIYVADSGAHKIVVFDTMGALLFSFGGFGQQAGEFIYPHGLAVDGAGDLFVADTGNSRVQVFSPDGRFKYSFGQKGTRVYDMRTPYDLSFDQSGHLYIIDREMFALFVYSPKGEVLLAVGGRESDGKLGFITPSGIDVSDGDRIYISDLRNQRISIWQYLSADYLRRHPVTDRQVETLKGYLEKQEKKSETKESGKTDAPRGGGGGWSLSFNAL